MAALRRVVRSSGMYRSLAINFHKSHTSVLKRTPRINMCGNVAGVHSFPSPEIKNEKAARTFIVTLDDRSRRLLYQEMQTFEQERSANEGMQGSFLHVQLHTDCHQCSPSYALVGLLFQLKSR